MQVGSKKFWTEGCCASAVGPSETTIAKYTREQEAADIAPGKLGVKEYEDSFKAKRRPAWLVRHRSKAVGFEQSGCWHP